MVDLERSTIFEPPQGSDWLCEPGNFFAFDAERIEAHVESASRYAEFAGDECDVPVVRLEDADELRLVRLGGSRDGLLLSQFGQEFPGCAQKLVG